MNIFLTVYNTPTWQSLVNLTSIKAIDNLPAPAKVDACALLSLQTLSSLSKLLESSQKIQQIWIAIVQAEYYIADTINKGQSLSETANEWKQLTSNLLRLQSKNRKKIKLFNLHQALENPALFREQLGTININEYPEKPFDCSLSLLAANQYLTQQSELKSLNTLLQASVIPLCENECLTLDVDAILKQSFLYTSELEAKGNEQLKQLAAVNEERSLIIAQLHQVQEDLEKYFHALQVEKEKNKNNTQEIHKKYENEITTLRNELKKITVLTAENTQLKQALQTNEKEYKHTLLARDKQNHKEVSKLEGELRKAKARAASAEFAGQLLQQELYTLKNSISWKAATPARMIGRLIKKTDEERALLLQQIGLLLTSEFFDVDWYLRTYKDVEESKMNPAEHYLLFGATEGRLPGPLFDGNWYLQHYPDVAEAKLNPLLHYIMYGQQEGRTSSPKLLTNNQHAEE